MAVYGIDLGTTYSCVACVDDVGRPTVLRNLEGSDTTPSVVYFESADSTVVGQSAKDAAVLDPERVVRLIKRDMGESVLREFHGRAFTPEEVSARILRKLADDARVSGGAEVRDVVITVPAYFGLAERDATRKAGEIAGLRVLDVVAEPIAAALDYGVLDTDAERDRSVLVFDLGGGTFDTTVLTLRGTDLKVLCTDGAKELGGTDFDDRIVMHLVEAFRARFPEVDDPLADQHSETQLRRDAEDAKRALSFRERYTVRVMHQGRVAEVELTRELVEELTRDLLDRTVEITRRTLALARERGVERFDEVLLVGGSTKMPAVAQRLREEFGFEPRLHNPDLTVARGAALYALDRALSIVKSGDLPASEAPDVPDTGRITRQAYQVATVAARGYGIRVLDVETDREYVSHLVHANDGLPAAVTQDFYTVREGQRRVRIQVMEQAGAVESDQLDHNTVVAEGDLDIPPGKPARWPFACEFSLGTSGLLEVVATERETGRRLELSVQIGGMTAAAVDEARVALGREQIT
ncbi:Hsp70 family protein [Kitasatospora sp. NPDC056184]|uniref:Hsp70 family protein n=1 Tax=Kitasatospora sp. NPDC056184 TaxID=3345738 RepID=UPI0035DC59F8